MSNLLSASDLCLIPSLLEAVSLSALESLACATPVLATNVGGLPEVIIEDKTGWLINPKSSEEIGSNLQALVRMDREILKQMGLAGRGMVENKYSWESVAKRVSIRYEEQDLG
jgi:glycosyltransferase involved in cell wall biosynthesis